MATLSPELDMWNEEEFRLYKVYINVRGEQDTFLQNCELTILH